MGKAVSAARTGEEPGTGQRRSSLLRRIGGSLRSRKATGRAVATRAESVEAVDILDLALEPRAFRVGSVPVRADLGPLAREIAAVGAYVDRLRAEMAELRARDAERERLPGARRELAKVREDMTGAAARIIAAAKDVLAAPATPDAYRHVVQVGMTAIVEACAFQDLAGQRLGSVDSTLRDLGRKLERFGDAIGTAERSAPAALPPSETSRSAEKLLEGPGQLTIDTAYA